MSATRALLAGSAILLGLVAVLAVRGDLRRERLAGTGRLIDVGGYGLFLECWGRGHPAVVLDSGLGIDRRTWDDVAPVVAGVTSVCAYDRAGLGDSDAGPGPRTSQQMVEELHALLANAEVAPPYVLVGHSFGGLNVRLYASRHPDEVAGMVLVDPSHEDQTDRFAAALTGERRETFLRYEAGDNRERADVVASNALVRAAPGLHGMPLIVLTAERDERWRGDSAKPINEARVALHADLARRVPAGIQIRVARSGHFIQRDRPESVAAAIGRVVTLVRARAPAAPPAPPPDPA